PNFTQALDLRLRRTGTEPNVLAAKTQVARDLAKFICRFGQRRLHANLRDISHPAAQLERPHAALSPSEACDLLFGAVLIPGGPGSARTVLRISFRQTIEERIAKTDQTEAGIAILGQLAQGPK